MLGVVASSLLACAQVPKGRYFVNTIKVSGNEALDDDEIEERLASKPTARFAGLIRGLIYDYEVFDRYVLERDLQRIERYYRARGYYSARVRAGRVRYEDNGGVRVHIEVEEGPPVLVRRVDIHGLDPLAPEIKEEAKDNVLGTLKYGEPFEEEKFALAQDELLGALADHGHALATVRRAADVDLPKNIASVGYWVEPGPVCYIGDIRIEGLGSIPEAPVRRALDLKPGTLYSRSEIEEAELALLGLGVFSSVNIEAVVPEGPGQAPLAGNRVPLRVRLEPSKLRSIHLGGGLQVDTLKTSVRVTAGWEHRNFFGGTRKFLVELQPGAVLYPTRFPSFEAPERLLPEARLRAEFRQPGFIEARTNALVRGQASLYAVMLSAERDPSVPVLGYRDFRISAGLERSLWKLYGSLTHNVQLNSPFIYVGTEDEALGPVVVSYPQLFTTLDWRDDRISPHQGIYVANDLQIAGVGGDARDIKVQPELRAYVPIRRRLTLAARGSLGFLFAENYGDTIERNALTGEGPPVADPTDPDQEQAARTAWVKDTQLMFLRGFFSGGAGSNRGYATRQISPHGVVPFFNPNQSTTDIGRRCTPGSPDFEEAACELPLGGFSLWELNLELRVPLIGALSGALFTDASDVAPRLVLRGNHPHVSSGLGFRYDTPIGPVRLDVGYRIPGLQAPRTPDEVNPDDIFGLPIAVSFGIGESF